MKLVNALTVFAFTLFMSMMVSAQAQAFDVGGLSYRRYRRGRILSK